MCGWRGQAINLSFELSVHPPQLFLSFREVRHCSLTLLSAADCRLEILKSESEIAQVRGGGVHPIT